MRHIRSWAPAFNSTSSAKNLPEKSNRRSAMKTALSVFFLSLSALGKPASCAALKN
jgi:hypothetical protein